MKVEGGKMKDELPVGWCWSAPDELKCPERYSLAIGPFGSNLKVGDYRADGVPLVFVREIRAKEFGGLKTKFVNHQKAEELKAHTVKGGDLLITKMGDPPGDAAIYPIDAPAAVITADCIKLSANPKIAETKFLAFAVECPQTKARLEEITAGVAQQKISLERFRHFPLPLAPLPEQKRIADKLEAVLGRVDACRARLDRVPALLKRFRQSVLAAATSGKLTEDWREENEVSDEWRTAPLGTVVDEIKNGLSPKPNEQPPGTPILRISSVRTFQVHQSDIRYLSPNVAVEPYRLKVGDLLFTRYNGSLEFVGVCGLVRIISVKGLVYPDKLIRVRVNKEKVLPDWIEIAANSPQARDVIENKARTSAGQTGISGKDLKELHVSIPTLPEQAEIVRRVEALFALADRIEARLAAAQATVARLTPATLAKAFRGELVPQAPNDEPAAALLARLHDMPVTAPEKVKRIRRT